MKKKPFTLLELTAAMGVLIIFMLFVMRFFNTSQDVMNRSAGKTDQYERARIVMDLLANDLQNIFYTDGISSPVYFQDNASSGNTEELSLFVLRPRTTGPKEKKTGASGSYTEESKTDMALVQYRFYGTGADAYTLKLGVAEEKILRTKGGVVDFPNPKTTTYFSDGDFGVLAEGVYSFCVIPLDRAGRTLTPSNTGGFEGSRQIPDSVRIEIQLMDGETAAAIKQIKKISSGGALPDALNPAKASFKGKEKLRTFFRIVEIDRGQY